MYGTRELFINFNATGLQEISLLTDFLKIEKKVVHNDQSSS